jgi:hypothetical protein
MANCDRCIHAYEPHWSAPCFRCNEIDSRELISHFKVADTCPIEYTQSEHAENHDPLRGFDIFAQWNAGKTAMDVTFAPKGKSALKEQVGGGHYKDLAIQPVEYIHANKMEFIPGCIVKYITRYKQKNGKQDLEKIKHFCDLLIELEYGDEK